MKTLLDTILEAFKRGSPMDYADFSDPRRA